MTGRPAVDSGTAPDVADTAAMPPDAGPAPGDGAGPAKKSVSPRGPSPWRTAFFGLAAAGLIGMVGWVLLGSRLLVVHSVGVTGTHLVPDSQVVAAAHVPIGLPLMRVDTAAVARRVERITQVRSATVSRDWPDRLVITVVERKPAVAVPAGTGYDVVDQAGVILEQLAGRPAGLPRFVPVGALSGNPGLHAAASVMHSLPASIAHRVRSVTAPTADAVTLHMTGGVTVDWGSTGLTAQKERVLSILLHTHAHYYDVSAPGTAVTG